MTTTEFLKYLHSLDIQVFADGERLHCNAPEGTLTNELWAELTARKAELIAFLQHTKQQPNPKSNLNSSTAPSLKPVVRKQFSPLSFAQQRLWFLCQLAPENPFYNVPAAIRLSGDLNLTALEHSFNEIVRRHEALRTSFTEVNGQPVQVIVPFLHLPLLVTDLQSVPANQRDTIAQRLATEEAQRPFNLETTPLLRLKLLQLEPHEFILLLTLHHIVSDGWSLGVLIHELSTFYTAFIKSEPAVLPILPIQYADFAHWQQEWLQGEQLESQLDYWRQQLKDVSILNLPTDRPRPAVQTYRGTTQSIQLSDELTKALEQLSQQTGASLFMTLLAAFQILLYRYTGQEDIAVGSPIANRHRGELEGLIGFFVNSLVLRTDLSGNPTFRELLSRVREVALAAYTYQDLPFEKIVEELEPERHLNQNPLFQVGFALQNAPVEQLELPGLTLKPMKFDPGTTRFDLEFHLWEHHQGLSNLWQAPSTGLTGFVAYSTDLFDHATITRMITHFKTLLESIVANPETQISNLNILTNAEQRQLLIDWNNTKKDYDKSICFHHLFERQVEYHPAHIAITFEDQQLTYQALDRRSNQLAHYLQQIGVGPNVLVALQMNRSLELMIAILGILKAGGAYVPLDPEYPIERRCFMLADTQALVLLTQSALVNDLPSAQIEQIQVIYLDQDCKWLNSYSSTAPTSVVTPEDLAYVIYTSGSTGKPKGVLVQHRGLVNVCQAQLQTFNLSCESRILQFSSLSFDAFIFETAMAFSAGGTLYLTPKSTRISGTELVQFLNHHKITHAILPPSVLALLPEDELPTLQTVIAGGEACSADIVERWAVNRRFLNAYGPTETTIWATVAQLTPHSGKPIIGRPIANTQLYILDANDQPVPVGVAGELYIGGDGLARGYLNRSELTAERFILNPLKANQNINEPIKQKIKSNHLYKTGDLARYRIDGSVEFLGRMDDQVKIRGFRIELGEIETVVRQHPDVREAVVIAHPKTNSQRLIAFVILNLDLQKLPLAQQTQQIEQWQTLYDQTYQQSNGNAPCFNIIGWNSSYTGQPIPEVQMREWVDERVQQILQQKPDRVLEIGCGTGLLLFRIAPHCTQYWATDFSSRSLQVVQQQLTTQNLPQVKLFHKLATDFTEIETNSFDAVILNSVVQYFPSIDYLLQVLQNAIQTVTPGGFIWIGDVRNLPLLSAFHAAICLNQSDAGVERIQLQQRVQRAIFEEAELVIDPAFFAALPNQFSNISHVQIQLSRGSYHNEMTQFRYNVILFIKDQSSNVSNCTSNQKTAKVDSYSSSIPTTWLDWATHQVTVSKVQLYLVENKPDILGITKVPNARVKAAVQTAEWLDDTNFSRSASNAPKTVGRMREVLENLESTIDPQDWWNLETELPYRVEICWSDSSPEGCYDVCLIRQGIEATQIMPLTQEINSSRPWETYANQPLQAQLARQLIPQLRSYLEQKLPDYMVPSAFVPLENLPLTPNGKINRRMLLVDEEMQSNPAQAAAAPRTPVEETLIKIWAELLRLKQVGIHDNFFELGGHSLLATQMTSRLRDTLGIEVPLRSLFEAPTIAQLAAAIETLQTQNKNTQHQAPSLVKLDRESRRRLRSSLNQPNHDVQ